jgi:hypothetical protein
MQPMKPEEKERLLLNNPAAAPADIEEYERLLAERFVTDPSLAPTPAPTTIAAGAATPEEAREARLAELYRKLYQP